MLLAATVLSLATSPRPARRVPQRRFVVQGGAFVVAAAAAPRAAVGWCGEAVPSWAFFVKWDDGRVPFEWEGAKGEAYCRVVGDRAREAKAGVPPILLVGTPGLGYDYLENLEALTVSDRRVVEVVFAGTNGAASAPLLTADACAAQLGAVVRSLGVQKVSLVAHGLGAVPALRMLERQPTLVSSLSLLSPYGSLADLRPAAADAVRAVSSRGGGAAAALLPTTSRSASASCVSEAAAAAADGVLLPPLIDRNGDGDSDRLGGAQLGRHLEGVRVPTLLASGGEADIVDRSWEGLPSSVKRLTFGASGHLPFVEQKEEFLTQLVDFLDAADGVATNRELKFADLQSTLREATSAESPLRSAGAERDCSAYKTEAARKYCQTSTRS